VDATSPKDLARWSCPYFTFTSSSGEIAHSNFGELPDDRFTT